MEITFVMKATIALIRLPMFIDSDGIGKTIQQSRFIPEDLLYLATPLLEAGFEVKICDMARDDKLEDADVYGITGLPSQFPQLQQITKLIRQNYPSSKIILGGPFITSAIKWLFDLIDFDLAVLGEAESVIVSVVEQILSGKFTKKEIVRAEQPISNLHLPALSLISNDMQWYLSGDHRPINYCLPQPILNNIMLSRGCPHHCSFCRQPFGNKVRCLSLENIKWILQFYKNFGVKSIHLQDDNLQYMPNNIFLPILDMLSELKIAVSFHCRTSDFTSNLAEQISQFDCVKQVCFGLESLNQESLNTTKKDTNAKNAKSVIKLCRDYEIEPTFFMIVGMPMETKTSLELAIRLVEEECVFLQCNLLLPIPGTVYWKDFVKKYSTIKKALCLLNGWETNQVKKQEILYNITELSDEELLLYYQRLMSIQAKFIGDK